MKYIQGTVDKVLRWYSLTVMSREGLAASTLELRLEGQVCIYCC